MTLENQVTSLELSKKLAELGVKQDSLFYWSNCPECDDEWNLHQQHDSDYTQYSAFTVAELGLLLPDHIPHEGDLLMWSIIKDGHRIFSLDYTAAGYPTFRDPKEANARAKALIYLIENKIISM